MLNLYQRKLSIMDQQWVKLMLQKPTQISLILILEVGQNMMRLLKNTDILIEEK